MIVYKSRVRPEANVIDKVRFRTGVTNYNHFAEIVVYSFFFYKFQQQHYTLQSRQLNKYCEVGPFPCNWNCASLFLFNQSTWVLPFYSHCTISLCSLLNLRQPLTYMLSKSSSPCSFEDCVKHPYQSWKQFPHSASSFLKWASRNGEWVGEMFSIE